MSTLRSAPLSARVSTRTLTPLGSTISINPSGRLAELAADTPDPDPDAPNAVLELRQWPADFVVTAKDNYLRL